MLNWKKKTSLSLFLTVDYGQSEDVVVEEHEYMSLGHNLHVIWGKTKQPSPFMRREDDVGVQENYTEVGLRSIINHIHTHPSKIDMFTKKIQKNCFLSE